MIVKEQITIYIDHDVEFNGLTLLSKEEYENCKQYIPLYDDWWWLRSSGDIWNYVYFVNSVGCVHMFDAFSTIGSVRPALILNPETCVCIGFKFIFDDHHWTVVSDKYALCDEEYSYMVFRKDWRTSKNANDYNASDIKAYLDGEWERMKKNG